MTGVATMADQNEHHWLSFHIGAQLYAAPLREVSEVIRERELTPVPGAEPDLLGILHLRGHIVPVLDGRLRLGLAVAPAADSAQVRIVLLTQAGQLIGLRVDAVAELLSTEGIEIAPPPPGRARRGDDPVNGVLAWRDGFVALLDVCRLCRLNRENGHVA